MMLEIVIIRLAVWIKQAIKIEGTNKTCDQTDLSPADFQKLTFADNLGVQLDEGTTCDYSISGLDQKIKGTSSQCSLEMTGPVDFTSIDFSENIGVSVSNCLATIKGLDQKIEGTWTGCSNSAVGPGDFKKLVFSDNTIITSNGDCQYTIKGLDQKVASTETDGVCGLANVTARDFKQLTFADNIGVSVASCVATVKGLDQHIQANANTCIGTIAVNANTDFNYLKFEDNLGVVMNNGGAGACHATIKGLDQTIDGTAATNCGLTNLAAPTTFKKLNFAENIGVQSFGDAAHCEFKIVGLNQRISSTRNNAVTTCMGQVANVADENFTTLHFTDNIGVTVDALDTCKYTIKGLDQQIKSENKSQGLGQHDCIATAPLGAVDFTTLHFINNIEVAHDAATCTASIYGMDQKIESLLGNCSLAIGEDNFTTLQFADGLQITKDAAFDCKYKIQKVLKVSDIHGEVGDNQR